MPLVELKDDYYAVLEVSQPAPIDDIKKSYRRLALLLHPDKNQDNLDATALFQLLNAAYETLKDDRSRRTYDCQYARILQARRTAQEQAWLYTEAARASAQRAQAAKDKAARAEAARIEALEADATRAHAVRKELIRAKMAKARAELARAQAEAARIATAKAEIEKLARERTKRDANDFVRGERIKTLEQERRNLERDLFEVGQVIRRDELELKISYAEKNRVSEDSRPTSESQHLQKGANRSIKEDVLARRKRTLDFLSDMLSRVTSEIEEEMRA